VLSFLHPRYATPYVTVLVLGGVSALFGAIGLLGGLVALMGLVLASNLGAFVLYAMLSLLTITAYRGKPEYSALKHLVLPVLGFIANLAIALAFPVIGILSGGIPAQASIFALAVGGFWLMVSLVYFWVRPRQNTIKG
jgi:amino acid transporter